MSGPRFNREKLNAFAEALANSGNVSEAARQVGVSRQRGNQFLVRMKNELGWQAC